MEMGHVVVNFIKILIVGAAGVGKTTFLRFLCDLLVLGERNSTPCIEKPQRVKCERIFSTKDSNGEIKWELVGPDDLTSIIAKLTSICTNEIKATSLTQQKELPNTTFSSHTPTAEEIESRSKVVALISKKDEKLFSVTWIYLVDSGGQPQFHELLTAFIKNVSLGIFVFKLSEQLDDKPKIDYYKNGKPCGEPYKFPLSHKEIFQHCIQTVSSLYTIDHPLQLLSSTEEKPEILVVGTHREEKDKSKETDEVKEQKLKEILRPYSGVITNDGKYIFPVDSIARKEPDMKVVDIIRRRITEKAEKSSNQRRLPLQYYILELELELQARKKGRDVISYEDCFSKIGSALKLDSKSFLAAIKHLDSLNLILYFESHAPDVIFVNPNTLLDRVGELVEKSYIWRGKVKSNNDPLCVPEEYIIPFINRGEVTLEILKMFKSYYEGFFDHITLAKILTSLFVFVPISEDKYFMPALLEIKVDDEMLPTNNYFAISFPGNAPMGLFSSLVVCLLSKDACEHNYEWTIQRCGQLFRNSITFKVSLALVILLDKRAHFEVHIKIPDSFAKIAPSVMGKVRKDVISAYNKVCTTRHLADLKYSECFHCPCSNTTPHLAERRHSQDIDDYILDCTKDRGCFPLEEWHNQWLGISPNVGTKREGM